MRLQFLVSLLAIVTVVPTLGQGAMTDAKSVSLRQGVPAYPGWVSHRLPNGRIVQVRQFGDEWYAWMETADGYTVRRDPNTGNYEYLRVDARGEFQPTGLFVGRNDPAAAGIPQHVRESNSVIAERRRWAKRVMQRAAAGIPKPQVLPSTSPTVPLLVILANFADTTTQTTRAMWDVLFNGMPPFTTPTITASVRQYYREVSYNKMTLATTVTSWITLPGLAMDYGGDMMGFIDWNVQQMVVDALTILTQQNFDFSPFDVNGDGLVEPIVLIHAGEGQEFSGNPDDVWSHSWNIPGPFPVNTSNTLFAYEYITMPELQMGLINTIGVMVHELGHAFGLPDLYDYGYDSAGAGNWELMASGSWNTVLRPGDCPAHLSVWSKRFLMWLDMTTTNGLQVSTKRIGAVLPAVEFDPVAYMVLISDPMSPTEYLMIENRQQIGFDAALPNYGMLAWHVDDSILTNDDQTHYHVALIQADGNKDLEAYVNSGDMGDPFPGWYSVTRLEPYSSFHGGNPLLNTNSYYPIIGSLGRRDVNIWFRNISSTFFPMTVDIRFLPNLFMGGATSLSLQADRPPITVTFRDGSQRPVFLPNDAVRYRVDMANQDDNYPRARLCEDTPPFWVEFWASLTGGITFDHYTADSVRCEPGVPGNGAGSVEGSRLLYLLPDGAYTPTVALDRLGEVDESTKVDNRWASPGKVLIVRFPTQADLVVRDFSFGPQWARVGDPIQLRGRVVNEGTSATQNFWIEFWGSMDAPGKAYPTFDFFLCDSIPVGNLAPGGSIDLSAFSRTLWQVPPHITTQTFSVGCFADRTDLVNEKNETNNYQFVGPVLFSTLGGGAPPEQMAAAGPPKPLVLTAQQPQIDLEREQLDLPELTVRESTVTLSGQLPPWDFQVNVTVHNWGLATAPASWVHVYMSRDSVLSGDDYLWVQGIRLPPLAPGVDYGTMLWTKRPAVASGVYRLLVQCDVRDEVHEAYENNNVLDAGPLVVDPDLTMTTCVVTLSGYPPPWDYEVYMILHNGGLTTATASWAHVYMSHDGVLSSDDYLWIQGVRMHAVPPGSDYTTAILTSRPTAPRECYRLLAQCDVLNEVREANESNNVLDASPIAEDPELAVTASTVTLSGLLPPTDLQVNLTVHNYGLTTAPANWAHIYVSRDDLLSSDDFLWIPGIWVPRLVPGATFQTAIATSPPRTVNAAFPTTAPAIPIGAYYMIAQCDVLNTVPEICRDDNVLNAGPLLVGPELALERVAFKELQPGEINLGSDRISFSEPGTSVGVSMRIVNRGILKADGFWLEMWGSRTGGFELDDFLLNSRPFAGLGPLSYVDFSDTYSLRSVRDGPYTFTAVVDRPNNVTEVYESNNRVPLAAKRLIELRPIRKINLRLAQFRFAPNPIRAGANLLFNGSVVNDGNENSGSFWIEFWGSKSRGIPMPEFQLCDSIYIENLRPGQQVFLLPYLRTVYWNVPNYWSEPVGDCTVMIIVDRPDNTSEYNEADNYEFVPGVVILP